MTESAAPFEINMPQLGLTMEYGTVAEWLIGEGDRFTKGQTILEVDEKIRSILAEAGATDVLYIVQSHKETGGENLISAIESATLEALFDGGGLISIE